MKTLQWPYTLPIWRDFYRAVSPDGRRVAQIDPAREVSMGNPTYGLLCVTGGPHLERCNPSFVWSDDSRYLAVPQFYGFFNRQRLLIIAFAEKRVSRVQGKDVVLSAGILYRRATGRHDRAISDGSLGDVPHSVGTCRAVRAVAAVGFAVAEIAILKLKLEEGQGKDPTVHPATAAGWGGGATNKPARIPTGAGQVGHPKASLGIRRLAAATA